MLRLILSSSVDAIDLLKSTAGLGPLPLHVQCAIAFNYSQNNIFTHVWYVVRTHTHLTIVSSFWSQIF